VITLMLTCLFSIGFVSAQGAGMPAWWWMVGHPLSLMMVPLLPSV